jgi:hypothetical protein
MAKSSGLTQGWRNFDFRFSIIFKKIILVALPARELNFDKFRSGELRKTNRLLSFYMTRTAYKTKKLGGTNRQQGDLISLISLKKIGGEGDTQIDG